MSALESLVTAVRQLEAELEQTRPLLTTPAPSPVGVGDDGIQHGHLHGYKNQGCRCPQCRSANAAYQRDYQAARRRAKQETT